MGLPIGNAMGALANESNSGDCEGRRGRHEEAAVIARESEAEHDWQYLTG